MTDQPTDDMRDGECTWCGDETSIFADNGLCEQCDSNVFRCCICNEDQHADDLCRHLFRDENLVWLGAGTGTADPRIRPSLFRLFNVMPRFFAFDLKKAIHSGAFYTWLSAPLIGPGGSLSLNGWPGRPSMSYVYGDKLMELGSGDGAGHYAVAYHWLASLFKTKTEYANAATVKWIDEWIKS